MRGEIGGRGLRSLDQLGFGIYPERVLWGVAGAETRWGAGVGRWFGESGGLFSRAGRGGEAKGVDRAKVRGGGCQAQ